MSHTNSNPKNFKIGTVIKTQAGTFTVYKKYKNSLLVDVEGQVQRSFIDFDMFKNRMFQADLISVEEPEFDVVYEATEPFIIGVDEGNIIEY